MCRGLDTNDTVIIDNEIGFVQRSLISYPHATSCKSFHMMQMHPPLRIAGRSRKHRTNTGSQRAFMIARCSRIGSSQLWLQPETRRLS